MRKVEIDDKKYPAAASMAEDPLFGKFLRQKLFLGECYTQ